ncbi:golgin subfamily A member 6-like protein 22 [Mangifera indica]|uniref:golgin subfamily A member 6-like protein 22 n=1 Tax=Mangifera indica TaxID=29780 RepID=UPI001CFB6A46|nr:golgin subfamily A member 6-like protein 22 [Mangifera indica]
MVSPSLNISSENQHQSSTQQSSKMTTQNEEQLSPPTQCQSPSTKTLTLEIPLDIPSARNSDQFEEDQEEDDLKMLTPVSQSTTPTPTRRPPTKRKKLNKQKRRTAALEKRWLKKLEILKQTLRPIPFQPNKKLHFSLHETLLKRVGLWDFVHLEFDPNIRTDLIAQIIANYNSSTRSSYVNGTRLLVNRADLSRALKLPVRKDKSNANVNASDGSAVSCEKESEDSIGFIQEVVSNWMLLHDDTWMMPQDVLNVVKMIKEGNFEKICWATFVWFMVEKEITNSKLENCYYASHLQCLIKCQKAELLREDVKQQGKVREEIKDEEEEREEIKEEEEQVREEFKEEEDGVREEIKEEEEGVRGEIKEEEEEVTEEVKVEEHDVPEDIKDGVEVQDGKEAREEIKEEEEEVTEEVKVEEHDVPEDIKDGVEVQDEKEAREEIKDEEEEVREEVQDEKEKVREEVKDEKEEAREEVKDDGEEVREEAKDEDEEDCDGDVKMPDGDDDSKITELEEHNIELCLGQDNTVNVKENVAKEEEGVVRDDVVNFGGSKNEEQQDLLLLDGKNYVLENEPFLKGCTLGDVKVMDCDEEKREEMEEEGDEEGGDEEDEEEEQQHEVGFALSPEADTLEMVTSANLIQGMEAVQAPFSNGIQICEDDLPGQFLSSRVDAHTNPGASSSHFGNGNKRAMDQDNEVSHLNSCNKRLRSGGSWVSKSSSDFHTCMEQIQHWMGKATMMYETKDQVYQESNVNQQMLINEVQKRDNMIEHLHKAKLEEQHKRQIDVYKLEHELFVMANVVEGYRKALKETHRAFAEYRARCPQADEPLYKDVTGGGGLVLSTMELEKQRVKQEEERMKLEEEMKQDEERRKLEEIKEEEERRMLEEEMKQQEERRVLEAEQIGLENDMKLEEEETMNHVLIEKKIKQFEEGWILNFEAHNCGVHMLSMKILDFENEVKHLKELLAKRKVSEEFKMSSE